MYPWPSFGAFVFKREEAILWGSDVGWILAPSFAQNRPIGATRDNVLAISIGSRVRTFEINLEPDRQVAFEALLNTTALFTDWERPTPDSRLAYLSDVTPVDKFFHITRPGGTRTIARRFRISLISQ